MKVVNLKDVPEQKLNKSLFTGEVTRQSPVTDEEGSDLSIDYVHFPEGIRNEFHHHENDQVLIVTEGQGFVETKEQKVEVREGDVIWAPAGEVHRHGAIPGHKCTHISVTRAKTKLTLVKK